MSTLVKVVISLVTVLMVGCTTTSTEYYEAMRQAAEAQASAADRDYQLRSALNLLKGLHILNRKNDSKPQENAQ